MSRICYIDDARSACLCDVGMPGYVLAVAVDPDGGCDLVLLDWSVLDCEVHNVYNPSTPQAPHEQLGPLPRHWRSRALSLRCGRPTKTGRPCRALVPRAGDARGWHNESETA